MQSYFCTRLNSWPTAATGCQHVDEPDGGPLPDDRVYDLFSTQHQEQLLQLAQLYSSWGWALIPVNGKVPTITGWEQTYPGPQNLQTVQTRIKSLVCNNLGVNCGQPSGIMVVDIDRASMTKNGAIHSGYSIWNRLVGQYGLPETLTVRTGKGGTHYYFRYDPNVGTTLSKSANQIVEKFGLDFRSNSGMIILPNSIHPLTGKRYQIIAGFDNSRQLPIIAEMPQWLKMLINKQLNTGI